MAGGNGAGERVKWRGAPGEAGWCRLGFMAGNWRFLGAMLGVVMAVWGQAPPFQVGDRVEVDVIMAGAPERSMWRPGTVKGYESEGRHVVVVTDPATDAGGRTIGIPWDVEGRWVRRTTKAAPAAAPAPGGVGRGTPVGAAKPAGSAPAKVVEQAPMAAAVEGLLDCPVEQPKVAQGARPNGALLAKVIRCLYEEKGQTAAQRTVKVDIQSLEIGTPRSCVPGNDFGCGIPTYLLYPVQVRWTNTIYYSESIKWSDNLSVFHCNVSPFGKWECGLGSRIRDGAIQTRPR